MQSSGRMLVATHQRPTRHAQARLTAGPKADIACPILISCVGLQRITRVRAENPIDAAKEKGVSSMYGRAAIYRLKPGMKDELLKSEADIKKLGRQGFAAEYTPVAKTTRICAMRSWSSSARRTTTRQVTSQAVRRGPAG